MQEKLIVNRQLLIVYCMFLVPRLPFREDKLTSVIAFLIFIVPLAFSIFTYENFETIKYTLWMILFGFASLIFVSVTKANSAGSDKWNFKVYKTFFWCLLVFLASALVSTIYSRDILNSFFGFYYRFTNSLLFYVLFAGLIVGILQILDKARLEFFAKILSLNALLIAVGGLLQSQGLGFYGGLDAGGFLRAPSFLGNPNFSSMFLIAALPFTLVFFFKTENLVAKVYYGLTAISVILCVFVLASRGAILGLVAVCFTALVSLFFTKIKKETVIKLIIGALLLGVLGWGLLRMSRPDVLRGGLNINDQNITTRLIVWKATLQGIIEHPLGGAGLGNFHIFFESVRPNFLVGNIGVFDDAHNLFLHLGATGGIPLFITFFALLVIGIIGALRNLRNNPDPLVIATIASTVGFIIASCFTPVSIGCFLLLAVVLSFLVFFSGESRQFFVTKKVLPTIGFFGVVLIIVGLLFIVSEHIFLFGYQKYFQEDYNSSLRLNKIAHTINPTNQLSAIYWIGNNIILKQNDPQVLEGINTLIRAHPNQARSYVVASNLYSLWYKRTSDKKYLQPAIENLELALKLDPFFSERYGQIGLYYYELGDHEKAMQYLNLCLSQKPDHFPAWMLIAKIYQQQGNRGQALFAIEKAYKLKPDIIQVKYMWEIAKREPDIKKVPIDIIIAPGKLE
jgi:O-antigen ligase